MVERDDRRDSPPRDSARDSNDEREKLSWRERDKLKDRSLHTGQNKSLSDAPKTGKKAYQAIREKNQAVQKLDSLFQKPKLTKPQQKALSQIQRATSPTLFETALRGYIAEYGFPTDWDTLLIVLDFGTKEDKINALDAIAAQLPFRSETAKAGLKSKINVLRETTFDSDILDKCDSLKLPQ